MAARRELPIYISLHEAAEITGLSTRTIRRRISDGTIPAYQLGRRPIRIRLDDLEKALRRIPSARRIHGATTSWPAWDPSSVLDRRRNENNGRSAQSSRGTGDG
jgi:excisionase family DNA binding protein